MPYMLNRVTFPTGPTLWLPQFEPRDQLDTAGYKSHVLPLSGGGAYDPDGDERLIRGPRVLTRAGQLIETSAQAIETAYVALAAASGLRGLLWRQNETGTRAEHMRARVMVDAGTREPRQIYRYRTYWVLDITVQLELQAAVWHGLRHGLALAPLDTGIGLDVGVPLDDVADVDTLASSPMTLALPNDGNAPVDDAQLQLTAGSADVTALSCQCGKARWTWTGLLPAGNSLLIDSGRAQVFHQTVLTAPAAAGTTVLTVANAAGTGYAAGGLVRLVLDDGTVVSRLIAGIGGTTTVNLVSGLPGPAASGREVLASAYAGFARDLTLHSIAPWLRLAPGPNSLVVTLTGGGVTSTLARTYFDSYL